MKTNPTIKRKGGGSAGRPGPLQCTQATAPAVCIAGSFNEWRTTTAPMVPFGDGRGRNEKELEL
jgi:L-cysteine desulfidase